MRDAWHDEGFARRWDSQDALRTNPDRTFQIDLLVALVAESCTEGARLLDLGVGSGRVEEALFERLPDLRVVGVDHSEAMLAQARERHRTRTNLHLISRGFESLESLDDPGVLDPPFELVICVQALHEVAHDVKRSVFGFVRRHIAPQGLFLVLDRFDYEPFALAPEYRCIWHRLAQPSREAPLSFEEYRTQYEAKTDHVAGVEDYVGWIRGAGFDAACLYHLFNRALIAARPKRG